MEISNDSKQANNTNNITEKRKQFIKLENEYNQKKRELDEIRKRLNALKKELITHHIQTSVEDRKEEEIDVKTFPEIEKIGAGKLIYKKVKKYESLGSFSKIKTFLFKYLQLLFQGKDGFSDKDIESIADGFIDYLAKERGVTYENQLKRIRYSEVEENKEKMKFEKSLKRKKIG